MINKKISFGLFVCTALLLFSSRAFSQAPPSPPPGGPPPPPPSPTEVFNKINPFKKKAKANTGKAKSKINAPATEATPTPPAGPPPPNPLNLFRKKRRDTSKKVAPTVPF